jgi:predicted ABC-class ATPase
MRSAEDLKQILDRIDGRGYKAYKDIEGGYELSPFELYVDHVQGDPFAAPSKLRVRTPQSTAGLPADLYDSSVRRIALQDYLARAASAVMQRLGRRRGSGRSGLLEIDAGGQTVLERTSVVVTPGWIELRIAAGLPANGRRVSGRHAYEMLAVDLVEALELSTCAANIDLHAARHFVDTIDNEEHIRDWLEANDAVAFIADGAVLPRASGASDLPLTGDEVVAFESPTSMRVSVDVPNAIAGKNSIFGMKIAAGVTLIVGGGYHGKSTLLQALQEGVYPHVPGDGREYVVTRRAAVKIRAEDGRRVERVDISPFISDLPYGRDTSAFSSDDASGSTSQAANIVEALEAGATTLLLDEDTSATNFMVRDARMRALVECEPITPFVDRVCELYEVLGVSTVLVMGGCGDYFDVADTVICIRDFQPSDATELAQAVAERIPTARGATVAGFSFAPAGRVPAAGSFDASRGQRDVKIDVKNRDMIRFGEHDIELRFVEQLVDRSQSRAVGYGLYLAASQLRQDDRPLAGVLDELEAIWDTDGLDRLDPHFGRGQHPGNFARPRRFEVAAAINRLRTLRIKPQGV